MSKQSSKQSYFAAIDLKSFYASVECVERELDPLTTNLVVADFTRTDGTICLAVSPSLKKLGLPGRCRLFEVKAKAREYKFETGHDLEYLVAPPRMRKYLTYSNRIYQKCYLSFVAPEDIFRYSIDEVFIDITSYLKFSGKSPEEFTSDIVKKIFDVTGLTATAGVGTNLYLAKVAMDILAKHAEPDQNGVRMAFLDEAKFKQELWAHTPLTDFWGIGRKTAIKLAKYDLTTFGALARVAIKDEDFFYKLFGVDAELFIDHLWGIEPTTMRDIKNYRSKDNSLSRGQVLGEPVNAATARLLVMEMVDELTLSLVEQNAKTNLITLDLIYDKSTPTTSSHGSTHPRDVNGEIYYTASPKSLQKSIIELFDRIVIKKSLIKRIYLSFGNLHNSEILHSAPTQLRLNCADSSRAPINSKIDENREESLSRAVLDIQKRFGKNAILKATSYEDGATLRLRNHQIGGHHE
ncbi:DNA methylase [Candidatus Saccharibacteria bacterium]|nr:DNA methylase [Candidatus Saccharibacteria bacterium]